MSRSIRAVIVDDEPLARERLLRLLRYSYQQWSLSWRLVSICMLQI